MVFYKKIGFWLLVGLGIIAGLLILRTSFKKIDVTGYEISKKDLIISVTATSTGTIKADNEVRLTAQRTGRVTRLLVQEGSIVGKGDLVAELEYDEAGQRLQIASAFLQRSQANLEAMKLGLDSFKTDIESNIARTSSVLNEAETRRKRYTELRDAGYLSQIEFDSMTREYEVAKAGYTSAAGAKVQIRSKEEEIRALDAAVKQARSEYAIAKLNYDYSFIRSPIAGVVTGRPVKLGDTVIVSTLMASVVSTDSLYVEAFIDEADVARISTGQPVTISMDAYPGRTFNGKIYMISPVVLGGKQEARTFEVRVRFVDRGMVTKPGMSADVEVIVDSIRNIPVLPSQAVIEKDDGKFVFLYKNGKAVLTPVSTGRFNWNFTEVTGGVKEGDTVITAPDTPGLVDGARVRIVKKEK